MKIRILLLIFFSITTSVYSQFNPYVRQIPIEAMRDVGIYKQRLYDERANWIQQKIYKLNNLNESLFNEDKLPSDFKTSYHKTKLNNVMVEYVNGIRAYDYSENYIFNSIQDNFRKIEKYYYDYYNQVVENYNNRNK
jgi:hypothetical protein